MFSLDILNSEAIHFQQCFPRQDASFKLLKVGDLFGDHTCFNNTADSSLADYAYAETDNTQVIQIDCERTKVMIARLAE